MGEGPSMRNVARLDACALPMVHAMSQRGIRIDPDHFERMAKTLADDMEQIEEDVRQTFGFYVNLDSGDQVSALLFKTLGIKQPRVKFTKSGDRESVEHEVLVAIQHEHPVVSKILHFKEYSKLRGTYVLPIPKLARRMQLGHWRLFPNFTTTRVPSGRFACKDPNLLAMPNRTARGREVRRGFITDDGWVYLSVDESQIEPRTVAHRSQDPVLMAVYHNREDLYSDFAISAFHLPDQRYQDATGWHYPGVDKEEHRFPSKTCSLAAIYRVTAIGLLEQMPVVCKHCHTEAHQHSASCPQFAGYWNENNCQDIINSFYKKYRLISRMQGIDDARARKFGYVWDDWGRLMHTAAVRSIHEWVVSAALREAGNMPIQGFACGTLKLTMGAVMEDLVGMRDVWHPLLPVHDEILSEVREDEAEEIGEHIKFRFSTCVKLSVPLSAEWKVGKTWGEVKGA